MSQADDILFAPVTKPFEHDHELIRKTKHVLVDTKKGFDFRVEQAIPIGIYDQLAELVENDPLQIAALKRAVHFDPKQTRRPTNALSIQDVFRRMHNGNHTFYFATKFGGPGVRGYEFENWFSLQNSVPCVRLKHQLDPNNKYEWWVLSLIGNFTGYNKYYAFGTEDEARKYNATP